MEVNAVHFHAIATERMEIAVADIEPINELDPEFEGRLRRAKEFSFFDAQRSVERQDGRNRSFANTYRSNLVGFDQRDRILAARQGARQRSGTHPTGCTTACDDDSSNGKWHSCRC